MLKEKLEKLKEKAVGELAQVKDSNSFSLLEIHILGRKGELAELVKQLPTVPVKERPEVGALSNEIKRELLKCFEEKKLEFSTSGTTESDIDITLPGIRHAKGSLHPVTWAIEELERIFTRLGFVRVRYNEVEWDYYAFEALNMPKDHPARDEWETFFLTDHEVGPLGKIVLTPHTSSGQVREMEKYSKTGDPIRMMNISKCYRRQIDISHTPMFHQFEGLVVDKDVTMTQLLGTLDYFAKEFFGSERKVRLRPYHFRFTEPSFEVDITCALCLGKGCSYCKDGWTELGGAGMVHTNVLKAGGYDPELYSGFAFGFGVERCYLMKNNLNIGDLRQLYSNDIRFLKQF